MKKAVVCNLCVMKARVQVLMDPSQREDFRRLARESGMSLSAWLLRAASEKAAVADKRDSLDGAKALRAFFASCRSREEGAEPEWQEHLRVIEASRRDVSRIETFDRALAAAFRS